MSDEGLSPTPPAVTDAPPVAPAARPVTALDGNRAVLLLLITQSLGGGLLLRLGLSTGLSLLLAFVFTVAVALLLIRPALVALIHDSRWRTPPAWGTALLAAVLGLLASRGVLIFVLSVWPAGAGQIEQFTDSGGGLWALLLAGGLLIPLAEEVAFRGLLTRGYERARGPLFAALASSALFGLAHGAPAQVLAILPLAWILARSVQHSGSLWTSYIIHALNNLLALGLLALLERSGRAGDLTRQLENVKRLPLTVGLAGLLLTVAALFAATLWLKPRPQGAAAVTGGPVWSGSLYAVVVIVALSVLGASGLIHIPHR